MQSVASSWLRQWARPCMRTRRNLKVGEWGMISVMAMVFGVSLLGSYFVSRREHVERGQLRELQEEGRKIGCGGMRPVYVFVHLHKTAGNSLKRVLFGFAKRNELNLFHTCHKGEADTLFEAMWFRRKKRFKDVLDCNLDALVEMRREQREKIDLVMGHQYVGVHTLFAGQDVRYFTFVRHPLMRKTSHYLQFEHANSRALVTYLLEKNRNYMTKRLATASTTSEIGSDLRATFVDVDSFAMRAALRAAKANLAARFFFVGIYERYEESICVLSHILNTACGKNGTKLAQYSPMRIEKVLRVHENERGETLRLTQNLSQGVKHAVEKVENADWQLYRYATKLFELKLKQYPQCRK